MAQEKKQARPLPLLLPRLLLPRLRLGRLKLCERERLRRRACGCPRSVLPQASPLPPPSSSDSSSSGGGGSSSSSSSPSGSNTGSSQSRCCGLPSGPAIVSRSMRGGCCHAHCIIERMKQVMDCAWRLNASYA